MSEDGTRGPDGMSSYERERWDELHAHWGKVSRRRQIMPSKIKDAVTSAGQQVAEAGGRAVRKVTEVTPEPVKWAAETALDVTLAPVIESTIRLLDLVTDWSVELTDPERVLDHHRSQGRDITSIADLRALDLELLDEVTRKMPLKWRTIGGLEGAAVGMLAVIPGPTTVASISADVLAMHVLSTSIATRVAYAYGFDPDSAATEQLIDRMVRRAYREQAAKVETQRRASQALKAASGRSQWSERLRNDHRILAAVENLMKRAGSGRHVSVARVAKAIPLISVVTGAGTNSYVLGDVATQAIRYCQTVRLADKHGLPLPEKLRHTVDDSEQGG